jgi:hypothetical protein
VPTTKNEERTFYSLNGDGKSGHTYGRRMKPENFPLTTLKKNKP